MSTKRRKRVLVIDDEPQMTEWLKVVLEHAGYDVRSAFIGVRGEELFRTWRPDAVLTDLCSPTWTESSSCGGSRSPTRSRRWSS